MQVQLSVPVLAGGDLFQSAADETTLARPEPVNGCEFVSRKVFREIFECSDVLADELTDVALDLSRRRIDLLPGARPGRDQIRDQDARHQTICDALSGIATDHEEMFFIGAETDKAYKVHRLEHLTRPSMGYVAQLRQPIARPVLERRKAP